MITKRIQIFTNRINIDPNHLTVMFQYYKSKGVTLNYDITPVNVTGYKSTASIMTYGGAGVNVLRGAETLVPQNDHDITIFAFDLNEWKAPWYSFYPLRSDMPRNDCELVNGKPFINLGLYSGDQQGNQMGLLHEPMHALAEIFGCPDQMDTYFKNNINQYQDPDSNFSKQWEIFKPYLNTNTSEVTLTRIRDNGTETVGKLMATNNGATFACSTLELPWKNNQHDISCIPKGQYKCVVSPFHKTVMYELQGTLPREGVFIHPGNFYTDILGCILLGINPSDINHDGQIDVVTSINTIKSFMDFMGNKPFTLTIQ